MIAIIGGGAAGMMAAASVVESGSDAHVVLIEKNPGLGRKVIISGGGRCNVTTGETDVRRLLKNYFRGNPFLTSALYGFPPDAVYEWFEDHGVPLKTENDNRVFPVSNNGHDVVRAFEQLFSKTAVEVRLGTGVREITRNESRFALTLDDDSSVKADAVIIATGGQAYRHTGSTGDGYTFAEALGHSLTPLAASLNSFVLAPGWTSEHSGVSFESVGLNAAGSQAQGPIVFTHKGLSGPAVFALSSQVAFEHYSKDTPLKITIDFAPNDNAETVLDTLHLAAQAHPKRSLAQALTQWLPKSVAEVALDENLLGAVPAANVSKKQRQQLASWVKACTVYATGRGAGSEFVTAGGVDTNEIDPSTMQSRITPGLFFAGEIMNVDGVTGGFNLQASWAAGRLAGVSATQ